MSDESSSGDAQRFGTVPGYQLIEPIGYSGSCRVYRAVSLVDATVVAIKIVMDITNSPSALKKFEHELHVSQKLKNAARVKPIQAGLTTKGLPCLCMELIDGQTLGSLLRSGHCFNQRDVIAVMLQVSQYLAELHHLGFVHGDIKPNNLMRVNSQPDQLQIKVLDLGVSRQIDYQGTSESSDAPSYQQLVSGSPSYMAPELVSEPSRCNPSSDIYALGCTAYELIAGKPPFVGNNPLQILSKHRKEAAATLEPKRAEENLRQLIMNCLEKRIQDRPKSAELLHEALRSLHVEL